jgi:hypothetical protein
MRPKHIQNPPSMDKYNEPVESGSTTLQLAHGSGLYKNAGQEARMGDNFEKCYPPITKPGPPHTTPK